MTTIIQVQVMKIRAHSILLMLILSVMTIACSAQEQDPVRSALLQVDGVVSVEYYSSNDIDTVYTIMFEQPINHHDPAMGSFTQKIYLTHRDFDAPVIFRLNGYASGQNSRIELVKMFKANQIYVEHRYFGESKPDGASWNYLSIEQSARDHHAIRNAFGALYTDKWISTGISKGGQTALFYKYFFPQDVTATVAYVAPVPTKREDDRIWPFIWSRGTEACQSKIKGFQRIILERRDEIEQLLDEMVKKRSMKLHMPTDMALEYMVAEYPYSFWQYHKYTCDQIPDGSAPAADLLSHLDSVATLFYYTDASYKAFQPAFYQFVSQIGYYNFDVSHLEGLTRHAEALDNRMFAPAGVELSNDFSLVNDVREFLITRAQNVVYIYGGNDPWSACAIEPASSTNSFNIVHADGDHGTNITALNEEERARVLAALAGWLNLEMPEKE